MNIVTLATGKTKQAFAGSDICVEVGQLSGNEKKLQENLRWKMALPEENVVGKNM